MSDLTKTNLRTDESILVCVYYGPNGERLIERGCNLASLLNCPIYILTIDPKPFDELDAEKSEYVTKWEEMADEHDVMQFIIKDNEKRPAAKVIAEVAREKNITQIVIGQTAKSRLEHITKGSIIDDLLRELQFVDLHIVSVSRSLRHEEEDENSYDKGVRAYLIKENDEYQLSFTHDKNSIHEGIFFKDIGTDFNNGIFKFMKGKETHKVRINDDLVIDKID